MLKLAFRLGGKVYIGLTSDQMAINTRKSVLPYARRLSRLERACRKLGSNFEISELNDPYGYSTRLAKLRGIVVSEATRFRVEEINRIRSENGYAPLITYVVPLIRTFDGLPISSTRIISGECDSRGHLLRPVRVGVGSRNVNKVGAVRDVFRLYRNVIGRASIKSYDGLSGVSEQPIGMETVKGAISRARDSLRDNDIGIGIEAGLFEVEELGAVFDVQYCVMVDRAGRLTAGHGMGFCYPPSVLERVAGGETVGDAMSDISGIRDIGKNSGAIGYLSHGKIKRRKLTEQAVITALIPRLNQPLYDSLQQ